MEIQLKTSKGKILYAVEKCELFPNYRSVLQVAIAYGIDLTGLDVENENLDGLIFRWVNLNSVSFHNCSMNKIEFIECKGKGVYFYSCNLNRVKFKHSEINELYFDKCELKYTRYNQLTSENNFAIRCDFTKSNFSNSHLNNFGFNSSNLTDVVFNNFSLDNSSFVHIKFEIEWIKNAGFIYCSLYNCDFKHVKDISILFFWESNVHDAIFHNDESFTKVINDKSKVLYAIDSDVVWWKPKDYLGSYSDFIFRGDLEKFIQEVENDFPITNIDTDYQFEITSELNNVCTYLDKWKKRE